MYALVTPHSVLGTEQVIKHIGDPACPGQWETKGPCGAREGMTGPEVGVQCGTNPIFAGGCEGSACSAHSFLGERDGSRSHSPWQTRPDGGWLVGSHE